MPLSAPPALLETVRHKLEDGFAPETLEIRDDSARHAQHREAAGRFHLAVRIVSERFRGLGPLERHRIVYEALAEELADPLHALRIEARAPGETPSA